MHYDSRNYEAGNESTASQLGVRLSLFDTTITDDPDQAWGWVMAMDLSIGVAIMDSNDSFYYQIKSNF